jgi:hypothetical protein
MSRANVYTDLAAAVALVVLVGLFLAIPAIVPAQETPAKPQAKPEKAGEQPTSFWMNRKLQLSQEVLAGITSGDFDKIVKNAQAMRSLDKVEAFIRGSTPGYRTQLQFFDESLDEIIRQAQKDNLEGAALGFTQLTISCVNCHKQLRAAK